MSVDAVSSAASTSQSSSTAAKTASLDYDAFLKLLVAQMSNQDPLNPTDSAEYMGQLANFSSVEQQIHTNTKLDSMMAVSALTQADSLIGRKITSADGSTTGIVAAVRASRSGIEAVTASGATVLLQSGTKVE
ncbi:flagellar hook assembly protein FlgD [Jiella pacifica]|uniref:Basal-body rod modification protein FlgD n=1 Tax=Jiella pacifica TaxID=2696469 RepID=A0A6N9T0I6_9HYPH|nr:flagellar hook assembly protein FlgD [Jiella pacifica]NDW04873.1 flagellar hook assembly protein FlgD [Jiella pacifica]